MKISIAMPAHNEAEVIGASVRRVDEYLGELGLPYEILVGDAGSTDGTAAIVEGLHNPRVRLIARLERRKGAIVSACLEHATGDYIGFIDSDLEIGIEYIAPMLSALQDGYDAAIASKTIEPLQARNRPLARRLATGAYNGLIRALFRTTISDHQAGLKLFKGDCIRELLPRVRSQGWVWDTEVLVLLSRAGRKILEVPVATTPREGGKVSVGRTSLQMLGEVARLYWATRRR